MTIIQLEYLLAVANCGSFSLAAEHCFVTQPSLSMQIKSLEEELGVVLLDRSKKPVIPTEAGEVVLAEIRETLRAYDHIREAVAELKGETSGRLRLGVIPTIAPYLLHKFIPDFVRDYPKVELEYEAMMNDPSTAYLVDDAEFDRQIDELGVTEIGTAAGMYIERGMYKVKKAIQNFFRELLEMLFQAASLTIDTIRTFFLIVLAILGPISFALSVWDGFQSTLTQWICRYIQTYLWLPVADLFSTILAKIQVLMLQNDISELTNNPNVDLDGSNTAYTVFMIIGIIGYFTIPTVAGWIIQAGGAGNYNRAVNNTAMQVGSGAASVAGGVAGNMAGRAGKLLK